VAVKEKLALVEVVVVGGCAVIVVSGGVEVVAWIVQVRVAAVGSTFPAESAAATWNLCVPPLNPL
jgi:hypothetical protein